MRLVTPRKIGVGLVAVAVLAFVYLVGGRVLSWEPGPRATFWVLVLAAVAAIWYAWLTHLIRRAEHTPVLTATYRDNRTIIRNNGKGAALNGVLTDSDGDAKVALGDIPPAEEREYDQNVGWNISSSLYLFYQDVFGRWYATKSLASIITDRPTFPVTNNFQGRIFNPPAAAARQASTRSAYEYMLQMAHWWSPLYWTQRIKQSSRRRWIAARTMWIARRATKSGALHQPFTPREFAEIVVWPGPVADRFIKGHLVDNGQGEKEYFVASRTAGWYFINPKVFL